MKIHHGYVNETLDLYFSNSIDATSQQTFVGLEDVFKTSWKTKNCYAEAVFKKCWRHILKTSWRHVLKTCLEDVFKTFLKRSWRHYGDKQNTDWEYLYLTCLNKYVTNLHFTNLYVTILRRIQNALIRTQ